MAKNIKEIFKIDFNIVTTYKNLLDNYAVENSIGEGTFGKVKLATHILTNEKVAIKILEKNKIKDQRALRRIRQEIKFLKKLRHDNIIQLYEIVENPSTINLIMEYPSKGEFFDYIVKKKKLNENEAAFFYYQIINGVEYIHKNHISHRDLKPENILLDENKLIKIIDFGLSNSFTPNNQTLKTPCGSPCYAAPEMLDGNRYSGITIDIWSTGIILYAMVCGYLPFEDPDNSVLFQKIRECKFKVPSSVSNLCTDFIKKLLNPDPKRRLTIEQIKNHDFYKLGEKRFQEEVFQGVVNEQLIETKVHEKLQDLDIDFNILNKDLVSGEMNNSTVSYWVFRKKIRNEILASKANVIKEKPSQLNLVQNKKKKIFNLDNLNKSELQALMVNRLNFNSTHRSNESRLKKSVEAKNQRNIYLKTEEDSSVERVHDKVLKFTNPTQKHNTILYNIYSNSKPTKVKYFMKEVSGVSNKTNQNFTPTQRENLSVIRVKTGSEMANYQTENSKRSKLKSQMKKIHNMVNKNATIDIVNTDKNLVMINKFTDDKNSFSNSKVNKILLSNSNMIVVDDFKSTKRKNEILNKKEQIIGKLRINLNKFKNLDKEKKIRVFNQQTLFSNYKEALNASEEKNKVYLSNHI